MIRKALELDDLPLSAADEKLVEDRLAAHHNDPTPSFPLEDVKKHLGSQSPPGR